MYYPNDFVISFYQLVLNIKGATMFGIHDGVGSMPTNPTQAQQPFSPMSQRIQSGVGLYIFTPRNHGSIQLRPLKFNFNEQMLNDMLQQPNIKQALGTYEGNNKSMYTHAILPDPQGISMDTTQYDNMWSFILVFDNGGNNMTSMRWGSPKKRTVLTGYFLDEPLNPMTMFSSSPTHNPNAMMLFTHTSSTILQDRIDKIVQRSHRIVANEDIVPQATAAHVHNGEELALVDAATIAKCQIPIEDDIRISSDAGAYLSTFNDMSGIVSSNARSPRHQLLAIADAMDTAKTRTDATENSGIFGTVVDTVTSLDPFDIFINEVYQNVASRQTGVINQNSIDPRLPIPLSALDNLFPNMNVVPFKIPINPEYEICDQGTVNPHNIMSSMIQSSIGVFASECLLASIQFRYGSWSVGDLCGMQEGQWQIIAASSMIGDDLDQNKLSAALNRFRRLMETSLFPIVKDTCGDFDLIAAYDMSSSTIIDLNLMDYNNPGMGYYEGHNRLGGMVSSAIGGESTLNNNRIQFDTLVNRVASVKSSMSQNQF